MHGYIVNNFAKQDDCNPIYLSKENIEQILKAVREDNLPYTEGFFFGKSLPDDKEPTIKIFEDSLKWIQEKENKVSRSIYYEASW